MPNTHKRGEWGSYSPCSLRAVEYSPVFVETSLALVAKMLSEDSFERTETTRCLDVANHTHYHHGWSLEDRHSFNYLVLVRLWRQKQCIIITIASSEEHTVWHEFMPITNTPMNPILFIPLWLLRTSVIKNLNRFTNQESTVIIIWEL